MIIPFLTVLCHVIAVPKITVFCHNPYFILKAKLLLL